jgi:outer membrane receptor for ferrienterochelin and colicins
VLNYGVNVRLDEFHHQRLDLKYTRLSYDAFIIDESDFTFNNKLIKGLKISPSLRYNGNTDFVDKLTPKIGLLLHLLDDGQLKILANTGLSYRSPTFNDLYWPEDSFSRGNQNLRPESGRDWDAGIRLKVEGLKVDVVYFDQYYTDLILWQDHAGMWWPENVSEARIRGLENSFKWDIISDHLDLYAQYTFMDARNLSQQYDNKYLSYRPVHTADIQLNGKILSLGMFFNTHIESKRYTTADNAEIRALPAYIKNDIGMNFLQKTSFVDILYKAEIKNLFDVDYQLLKDYPLAGREIKLSIQIKFNKQMKERK